jgi:hypothetical protein
MTFDVGEWADKLGGRHFIFGPFYDILLVPTTVLFGRTC